jgi:hypothetical protein
MPTTSTASNLITNNWRIEMGLIIFAGDWVYTAADKEWHRVVDCDGGMYALLDHGFWVFAQEPEVEKVLSADEFTQLYAVN